MALNRNLHSAKRAKNDDFHTQLSGIENELRRYKPHFKGKTVCCSCDDPKVSNFFHCFSHNFWTEEAGRRLLQEPPRAP